jgi:glycosyltransferase involved in cell wall biosynthesis
MQLQRRIKQQYGIAEEEHILFFTGSFNYPPNLDALKTIIEVIEPLLLQKKGFRYKILICGIEIPPEISRRPYPNIIIAGFVDDIVPYFKAADVFLNPIIDGGGIKIKLVDALSYNRNVVSTVNGAIGVEPSWCNGKLLLTENGHWQAFADAIPVAAAIETAIPPAFFAHFYWENIAKKTVAFISVSPKP